MRALVLIGGEGTRLRPLTFSRPKSMLPVAGRPMITQTIEWLASHGVDEVIFSLGYRPDAFQQAFPDASFAGVRIAYAIEPELLDTAGAIRFAAISAGATDERLVVVNGDVLTDLDLTSLVDFHEETGAEATINLTPVDDPSAFGVVPTDESGRVLAFIEKPSRESAPTNAINAGTYVLEPAVLSRIASDRRVSIEREVFPAMVADGALFARLDHSYWIDTGTPRTYLQAQFDVLDGLRPSVRLPEHEVSSAGVFVAPGARLSGAATGPVLLCEDAVVEPGALVERCVLGAGVVIAANAIVRNAVLLEGSTVGEGARVEDSIVGGGAQVGARSTVLGTSILGFNVELAPGTALDGALASLSETRRVRALVTGGAGFLGSSLVDRLLAEGHSVDVVDDLSTGSLANLADARQSGGALSIHRLDVRERDVVDLIVRRRPDVVFHLAGRAVASESLRDPVADTSLALLGGLRVLEGARDAAVSKVVVGLSASDLYGTLDPASLPVKETVRGELASPRGGAERALLDELGLFRSHDRLEFAALALSTIYGLREPDSRFLSVRSLVEDLLEGRVVSVPGDGTATRDFLFIDDAVDALSRAATQSSGVLLNVGTGRATSLLGVVEAAAAACGVAARPLFGAWPDGEPPASCLDASRASIHLDWRAWTTLGAGVREIVSASRAVAR